MAAQQWEESQAAGPWDSFHCATHITTMRLAWSRYGSALSLSLALSLAPGPCPCPLGRAAASLPTLLVHAPPLCCRAIDIAIATAPGPLVCAKNQSIPGGAFFASGHGQPAHLLIMTTATTRTLRREKARPEQVKPNEAQTLARFGCAVRREAAAAAAGVSRRALAQKCRAAVEGAGRAREQRGQGGAAHSLSGHAQAPMRGSTPAGCDATRRVHLCTLACTRVVAPGGACQPT